MTRQQPYEWTKSSASYSSLFFSIMARFLFFFFAFAFFIFAEINIIISSSSSSNNNNNNGGGGGEVAHDFTPFIIVYKNGTVQRLMGTATVPPSLHHHPDPTSGVISKDVLISHKTNLSARLYLPNNITDHPNRGRTLPVLLYFHGGAFCTYTPFNPQYHAHLNRLTAAANVVAVSVNYRIAPEHPLPIGYDDVWAAAQWVASHSSNSKGPDSEPWLRKHADLRRVFVAGDSSGANFAHDVAVRAGEGKKGAIINLVGLALVHPFFGDVKRRNLLWDFLYPVKGVKELERKDPASFREVMGRVGSKRVVVFVAEKDWLMERGLKYYEALKESKWGGDKAELVETRGEGHTFHINGNPNAPKAVQLVDRFASFINY